MKATLDNPYEKLYREMHPQVTGLTSATEAEDIARHLGHMYNAVGTVVKDITKILSFCFNNEKNVEHNAIEQEKQQNINSLSMEKEVRNKIEKLGKMVDLSLNINNEKNIVHFDNVSLASPMEIQSNEESSSQIVEEARMNLPVSGGENGQTLTVLEYKAKKTIWNEVEPRMSKKIAKKGCKSPPRERFDETEKKSSQRTVKNNPKITEENFIDLED